MIDFRYHIVSLISVFLALAVGIILGAGPLKETIGDSLTGQVQALRTEKDALRTELEDNQTDLSNTQAYVTAIAPELLDGVLPGTQVGIVLLGPVDDTMYNAVTQQIEAAGATVTVKAQLLPAWTDPEQADARQSYAASLSRYLPSTSVTDGFDVILARALVLALTSTDATRTDTFTSDATQVREILVQGNLIDLSGDPIAPVDQIVFLVPPTEVPDGDSERTAALQARAAATVIELKLVAAAQDEVDGTVVAGTLAVEGDLLWTIRTDQNLAASTTTVSDVDVITGQVNVPLALAADADGTIGQYGSSPDSTAPVPPTVEPSDSTSTDASDPATADDGSQG